MLIGHDNLTRSRLVFHSDLCKIKSRLERMALHGKLTRIDFRIGLHQSSIQVIDINVTDRILRIRGKGDSFSKWIGSKTQANFLVIDIFCCDIGATKIQCGA